MSCNNHGFEIHKNPKEDAGHWLKEFKVWKQSKKEERNEKERTSTLNRAFEKAQASLPNITYLSVSLPPLWMNHSILATIPMGLAGL